MSIELNDIAGSGISKINQNFQNIENWINLNALWRQGVQAGQANQMEQDLDLNGYNLLNVGNIGSTNPSSLLTVGTANSLYVNVAGDAMAGPLNVRDPVEITEPARKGQLDQERSERQSNDASLQTQITQAAPLMAAERPVISWHPQVLTNSVVIPDNMNAQTTGPLITLAGGVVVTVGENSAWTILNGDVQ